jgi:hypothetical protein
MTVPQSQLISADVSLATVQPLIARHIPLYKLYAPTYHTALLQGFRRSGSWARPRSRCRGGTGIIAQAMKDLFGTHVTSIDVEDRFSGRSISRPASTTA